MTWVITCSRCGAEQGSVAARPVYADLEWERNGWVLGPPAMGDESGDLCPDCAAGRPVLSDCNTPQS